ncbi:MAG: hypothetical protein EXS30_03140 [Pedosphaera sp.]|nr:hypothetical protein [Pedosphaera sp.]
MTRFRAAVCFLSINLSEGMGSPLTFVLSLDAVESLKEDVSIREAAIRISEWFSLPLDKPSNGDQPNEEQKQKQPKPDRSQSTPRRKEGLDETGPNKPLGFELQHLDAKHPYLAERGLSEETIAEFGLGYCNKGSMSGHVVIPIHNVDGKIVAYAGRWPGEPAGSFGWLRRPGRCDLSMETSRRCSEPADCRGSHDHRCHPGLGHGSIVGGMCTALRGGATETKLQGVRKAEAGGNHPDRDRQCQHINEQVSRALAAGKPVVSVDT